MGKETAKRKSRASSSRSSCSRSLLEKKVKDSGVINEESLRAETCPEVFHEANGAESDFSEKIDCIVKKLSKLEDIDLKLDGVTANVKALELKVMSQYPHVICWPL